MSAFLRDMYMLGDNKPPIIANCRGSDSKVFVFISFAVLLLTVKADLAVIARESDNTLPLTVGSGYIGGPPNQLHVGAILLMVAA